MRFAVVILLLLLSFFSVAQGSKTDTTITRIENLSSKKEKASAYNDASESAWRNGELQNALEYSKRGLKIAKKFNFKKTESKLHNNRGVTYDFLNQYPTALKHLFTGLTIQDKLDDPETKADILGNIGLIYMYQLLNDKSLNYHKRALKIRQEIDDRHGISASLNNIAIIYSREGNHKKAIENYLACIEIDTKANDTTGLGDDYNNIALVYTRLDKFDLALEYLEKALKIRKSNEDIRSIAETYSNFGALYHGREQYDTAQEYFLLAADLAHSVNDKASLKYIYEILSENEEKSKDSIAAYKYYRLFIAYRDSIDNSALSRKQTELELNYQFNKEKEVARLKQQEKDRQYKIILIAISSGLILILLFSILFFRKWKQTQAQQVIIKEKNELVQHKNDEIMASISYAKRIQKAILPSSTSLDESFPDNFVLYLPKDIVSGDFYWMDEVDSTQFLAVADCTGHGVPGAMMSVVCHNALNRAIHEFGKTRSSDILDKTRELVIIEMSQHEDAVADGMDISLCAFDKKSSKLNWAGANNSLWIYRKSSGLIEEIKADKQPIGNHQSPTPFTGHGVELQQGDRMYLFSDGYQDQFGGVKQKKLMRKGFKNTILNSVELSMQDQNKFLLKAFRSWQGEQEQVDDVCLVCVEWS